MNNPPHSRRWPRGPILLATVAALTLQTQLAADTFGTLGNTFTMDFVTIGNPGNLADDTGYGVVPYAYRMGTYEVSREMITKANNAGGLSITLFNLEGFVIGGNRLNHPATGVSWHEAAAFVNWLNVSTGHQPAYNVSGATLTLWPSSDAWQLGGENLYRHKDAYYFLPSENEWYKAAYYDGRAGVYYNYPTGSDSAPAAVAGGITAGTAVHDQAEWQGPANMRDAGGLSPYGTMAQGGNVWEWMEGARYGANEGSQDRGLRGGYWVSGWNALGSSVRGFVDPAAETAGIGFRVAAIPEPVEVRGVLGLTALGFALWRRRGSL